MRRFLVLVLLLGLSALPARAASAEQVKLRWKLPQGVPVGYELISETVDPGKGLVRIDVSSLLKDRKVAAARRKSIYEFQMPTRSAMALVLSAKRSGDLGAKVVLTKVDTRAKGQKKMDRKLARQMEKLQGTVQIRATLTDWGLATTELSREHRNLLALACELPAKAVGVGDSWSHSADLVKMGDHWQGESENLSRVELVELTREAEGRTVAHLDFTLAERQDGYFEDRRRKRKIPAFMESAFIGRGEFLVEEGRWRRLAGRLTTRAEGLMKADLEQHLTLTPLDPIPPKVLAAE